MKFYVNDQVLLIIVIISNKFYKNIHQFTHANNGGGSATRGGISRGGVGSATRGGRGRRVNASQMPMQRTVLNIPLPPPIHQSK